MDPGMRTAIKRVFYSAGQIGAMNASRLSYSSGLEVGADLCEKEANDIKTKSSSMEAASKQMTTTSTTARKSTTTKTLTTTKSTTKKTTTTTKRTTEKNTPATTEQKSTTQKSSGSQIASVKKSSAANHQSTFMNMVTIFFVFMALNKL